MKYLLWMLPVFLGCNGQTPSIQKPEISTVDTTQELVICPDGNIEYDADSIPPNLISLQERDNVCEHWFPKDTLTSQGNYVKYLISNDSCCLGNLYIAWGNDHFKDLICLGNLRLFHPRVYPQLECESEKYLILASAASSGLPPSAWEISLFPLHEGERIKTYELIYPEAFDPQSMTLIRKIEQPTETHFLEAYNIITNRTKQIYFKHRLSADEYNWSIDSISVTPQSIFLLVRTHIDEKPPVEEIVKLKNNIWQ